MNTPASLLLLPEDDDLKAEAFHRLLYHYIRAVQHQHQLVDCLGLQPLIEEVDKSIRRSISTGDPRPATDAI